MDRSQKSSGIARASACRSPSMPAPVRALTGSTGSPSVSLSAAAAPSGRSSHLFSTATTGTPRSQNRSSHARSGPSPSVRTSSARSVFSAA